MAVLFAALSITACHEDTNDVTPVTNEVRFMIGTESCMSTRAISDGTGATQLSWAVFNDQGELIHKKATKEELDEASKKLFNAIESLIEK